MASTLTTRSQDALSTATRHAATAGNVRLEPVHLLHALLTQEQGVPAALLEAVGSDPGQVAKGAQELMDALPSAQGDSVSAPTTSRGVLEVLQRASDLAGELGDEYVSTEHLLVGLATVAGPARELLVAAGGAAGAPREGVAAGGGSAAGA